MVISIWNLWTEIKRNIYFKNNKYTKNEEILKKYIWLEELLKWIEGDSMAKLNFKYFNEYLKNINQK